ncbi:hypothetical protein [Streptomyces sp. CO7]
MTRRTDRRTPLGDDRNADRPVVVAVVVPEPADAIPLVMLAEAGSDLAVVALRAGTGEGSAALERALAQAADRGCLVSRRPRVLDVEAADCAGALREELGRIAPAGLLTLDPDPEHVSFDEASGTPGHQEPPARALVAAGALTAARALQLETRNPVEVDCLRAGADPRLGMAACRRYPAPVNWLTTGFDGRLTAVGITAAGVVRWHQELPDDSAWRGPELLDGPVLAPGLAVVHDPHGFPHFFGLSRTPREDGGVDVAVVHTAQFRTGRTPTPWNVLGAPNQADWRRGRETGFPAAAFDGAGNLFVFVRNFGHSISCRRRTADGAWAPWQHLGGTRVADDLVAVTTPHGGVEVYARARDTDAVVRWHLGQDGAWAEDRTVPFAVRPGSMAPAPEPGAVHFRDLRTNAAAAWWPGVHAPLPIGDVEGSGPPATAHGARADGWAYSLLARSGATATGGLGAYPEGRPGPDLWWQDFPAPARGAVAVAVTREGRTVVAVREAGRRLLLARQRGPSDPLTLGAWHIVGH